jgi:hypothetical protein
VIAFPVVVLIIMLALQFSLWLHAAQIAEAAAQEAVEAAQAERADVHSGDAAARSLLAELGALRSPAIAVDRTASTVTSQVTGHAQQLVPGFSVVVSGTAQGPVERFIPEFSG